MENVASTKPIPRQKKWYNPHPKNVYVVLELAYHYDDLDELTLVTGDVAERGEDGYPE